MPVCFTRKFQLHTPRKLHHCPSRGINPPFILSSGLGGKGGRGSTGKSNQGKGLFVRGWIPMQAHESLWSWLVILKNHLFLPEPEMRRARENREFSPALSNPRRPHLFVCSLHSNHVPRSQVATQMQAQAGAWTLQPSNGREPGTQAQLTRWWKRLDWADRFSFQYFKDVSPQRNHLHLFQQEVSCHPYLRSPILNMVLVLWLLLNFSLFYWF